MFPAIVFRFTIFSCLACVLTAGETENQPDAHEDNVGAKNEKRMWHGSVTSHQRHPYFASIVHREEVICGGAFVTPQIVITAAHCVQRPLDQMLVRFGVNSRTAQSGFNYKVTAIFSCPDYVYKEIDPGDEQLPDIALVRLDVPIKQTDFTINLPQLGEDERFFNTRNRSTFVSMGSSFNYDAGGILKEASIRMFSGNACKDARERKRFTRYKVCAFGEDGDFRACTGMSYAVLLTA